MRLPDATTIPSATSGRFGPVAESFTSRPPGVRTQRQATVPFQYTRLPSS